MNTLKRKDGTSTTQLEASAYHEAGHGIASLYFGRMLSSVGGEGLSVDGHGGGLAWGRGEFIPHLLAAIWDDKGSAAQLVAAFQQLAFERDAIVLMAGWVAERAFHGIGKGVDWREAVEFAENESPDLDGSDSTVAARLALQLCEITGRPPAAELEALEVRVSAIVREAWPPLALVADALHAKLRLTAEQVEGIVGVELLDRWYERALAESSGGQ